jgi:hypothetical protein
MHCNLAVISMLQQLRCVLWWHLRTAQVSWLGCITHVFAVECHMSLLSNVTSCMLVFWPCAGITFVAAAVQATMMMKASEAGVAAIRDKAVELLQQEREVQELEELLQCCEDVLAANAHQNEADRIISDTALPEP